MLNRCTLSARPGPLRGSTIPLTIPGCNTTTMGTLDPGSGTFTMGSGGYFVVMYSIQGAIGGLGDFSLAVNGVQDPRTATSLTGASLSYAGIRAFAPGDQVTLVSSILSPVVLLTASLTIIQLG